MTLFDLFTANAEWDTNTELTISYNHLGNTKWDSGQALDIIYKYEKFEVLSFYKNSLFLREQEREESTMTKAEKTSTILQKGT